MIDYVHMAVARNGDCEITIPLRGDVLGDALDATVTVGPNELSSRAIEQHLKALGWSRSAAKRAANNVMREARKLLPATGRIAA
jgi:hypothetical protein